MYKRLGPREVSSPGEATDPPGQLWTAGSRCVSKNRRPIVQFGLTTYTPVRVATGNPAPKPLTDEGSSQAAPPVADLRAAGLKLAVTSLAGVSATRTGSLETPSPSTRSTSLM